MTHGVGLCQRRGGPLETLRARDTVAFAADEEHWHGAAPDRHASFIDVQQAEDTGLRVSWGNPVRNAADNT